MLLVYAGLFEYVSKKSAENLGHRLEKFELPAQRLNTLGEQCWHWITASWTMVNPWTWEKVLNPYNVNLWSLPAEFRSSIVLFIVVLGLARLKTCYRLLALSCVIWNAAVYHKWEVSATLAGMILAELDSSQGTDKATKTKSNGTIGHRARELSFFLVALYLASYPDLNGERTPGYRTLSHMIPAHLDRVKCWQTIGCMMVVHSVNHSSFIQKLFAGPLIQYLGEISYSVYIVHGPILHSVGVLAISYCWKHAGRSSLTQKYVSFALAAFTVTPVLFYAAHCFKKLVDVPCGRFTRWLEVYLTSVGTGK
ncbi:uncharacterized protein A1O9_08562 [Exophiala aquamarina CBS 119918]|uniref:Acyltransferase 3 domain-containing protein n=1 Tax=Exophiala aquamarina CBS 119918 TaxID=1182545 RepID=A0A072P7L6_9EURO|nr:uncharacterized protein A1O9_08562 [Exophiala aquamarina CBS 119918]KEF55811.1 hypothetical protein A1O9_08562 [Exophiala aquamarina CBS 119918]